MVSYLITYMLGILLVFGGNQNHTDLLDTLSTDLYWQIKNVSPSLAQLERDAGPDGPLQNIEPLLKDLQSDDFQTRDKAQRELESMGPGIAGQLRPAASSKDPEVAAVASRLLKNFTEHGQERTIRRLMAIRTLGERREKDALPLLNALKDSRELFVGDYAQRAIARIEGRPYQPADQTADLQHDMALLPAESDIVAQTTGLNPDTLSLAALVDRTVDAANFGNPALGGAVVGEKPLDKRQVLQDVSRQLTGLIEHVGNVRLDAVTLAYGNKKEDANWAVIIVRGKYDSALMYETLKPLITHPHEPEDVASALSSMAQTLVQNIGDLRMITIDDEMCMVLPNDRQLVLILTEKSTLYVRNTVCSAIRSGKAAAGTLADNPQLSGLLKQVDTHSPAWAVGRLTQEMRRDDTLGAFATFTLDSRATAEGVSFSLKAQGAEPDKVKASVDKLTDGLKMAQVAIQQEVQQAPAMQPVADFVGSIKIAADSRDGGPAKSATLTGQLKPGLLGAIVSQMGPMILEEMRPRPEMPVQMDGAAEQPAAVEIAPDPQPAGPPTQPK